MQLNLCVVDDVIQRVRKIATWNFSVVMEGIDDLKLSRSIWGIGDLKLSHNIGGVDNLNYYVKDTE